MTIKLRRGDRLNNAQKVRALALRRAPDRHRTNGGWLQAHYFFVSHKGRIDGRFKRVRTTGA